MDKNNDQYTEAETARRRDEVIRRMANTPPQPRVKSLRPRKKKKPTGKAGPNPKRPARGK